MVARPLARAEPRLPRPISKQQSTRSQFVVRRIYEDPPGVMVRDKNRSTMLAAQAAFCGREALPHFAAVRGMSNKMPVAEAHRTSLREAASPLPRASEPGERLEGWKQIAAYLKRDVRTIQRWERAEQFPVRRQMHRKLGSVLAFKDELNRWVEQRCSLQIEKSPA